MAEMLKTVSSVLICMLVLLPAFSKISSQETKHNSISVSPGLQYAGTRDHIYSPLLYMGTDALLSIEYRYKTTSFSHGAEIFYSTGTYEASTGSSMDAEAAGIKFGYHRNVYTASGGRLKLSAGALFSLFFLMRTYDLVPSLGGPLTINPTPEYYSSINLAVSAEYILNEQSGFNCRIWLPMVSYFLRSEYTEHAGDRIRTAVNAGFSDIMEAGQTAAPWGDYFHAASAFAYERKLSEYFLLGAEYSLLYQKVKIPLKKEIFNNALRCRVTFVF